MPIALSLSVPWIPPFMHGHFPVFCFSALTAILVVAGPFGAAIAEGPPPERALPGPDSARSATPLPQTIASELPLEQGATPQPESAKAAVAPPAQVAASQETACPTKSQRFDFSKTPPCWPLARPGNFTIPPSGCGYYTLFDWITGDYRTAPRFPFGLTSLYNLPFFDYDFRYLDNPDNAQKTWSDGWKRMVFCDDWLDSMGGEFRYRTVDERNSRGRGVTNDYYLLRTRTYNDLWYKDEFRAYVEFIYAETMDQALPPLLIDATGPDLLDAFVEMKVGAPLETPLYLRVGRQEMWYGSQRLVSTPDWSNTRRTFQGVKAYWHSPSWDFDVFWTQPVIPDRNQFDSVDDRRNFFGFWATCKPRPGTTLDLYYLGFTTGTPEFQSINGDVQTLGSRYAGDIDGRLLFDGEGMVQFGERGDRHIFAHAATGGLGWRFKDCPGNVQVWAYYDVASGTPNPADPAASYETFNQLFPYAHYYLGFLDLVARQNMRDLNFHLYTNPMPWISTVSQLHFFRLDQPRDALYNASGAPYRVDPTGRAGNDVGTELDLLVNFHLSMHSDLVFGYSKLYAGRFWQATGPPSNPDLVYTQYTIRW